MLDTNLLIRQEELNNKLVLLKQIKIILESLMFDNQSFSSRSSWQNFSGTMTIFARHIFAVLEDGLSTNADTLPNSPAHSPLSCSPIQYRTSTVSSSSSATKNINLLWQLITNNLLLADETDETPDYVPEDLSAKKDFTSFYVQLSDTDQTLATRKLSTVSSKSILSISDQCNLPLEWIIYSLRQNILLNQLRFLVSNEKQMRCYYKPGAFLLDRSFSDDLFNYIRAYELRDFSMLSKVKRNFFNVEPAQTEVFNGSAPKSRQQQASRPETRTSSAAFAIPTGIEANLSVSPSSINSRNSSVTTNTSHSSSRLINTPLASDEAASFSHSVVENAVNEVNLLTLKRHAKSHRRMFSVPNIQINIAKRNSMAVAVAATPDKNAGVTDSEAVTGGDESFSFEQSFDGFGRLNAGELNTGGLSSLVSAEIRPKSHSILSNDSSIPVFNLNDQLLVTPSPNTSSFTNLFECSPPASPTLNSPATDDIYQQTNVFAFIHSQQINLECSQLDKENSHFIIADISIAAFELIKTQDLVDSLPALTGPNQPSHTNKNSIKNLLPGPIKYPVSSQIRINRPAKGPLAVFDSPSDTNSPNTTSNFDFATTSMACSMDHETIINSGFASPNLDMQSLCSGVAVAERDLEATPTKMLSRAQSVVSLVEEDQAISRRDTLLQVKSISSADLQATCVDDTAGDERLITIRDKWLMAARRIVINQSVAKSGNVALDDTDKEGQSQKITRQTSNDETADNSSTSTQTSDTCLDQQQKAKSRGRRFSWEEIINLDTAEHIATRLIERHIDVRTTLFRKNTKLLTKATVNIPNLRQLEHAIQKMEYYEYMQTYYELRSGGLLEKYLAEALKKAPSNKPMNNSLKMKQANTIAKIKTAAVAAAAAVSIEKMQAKQLKDQQVCHSVLDALTYRLSSLDKEHGKNYLIRQISVNINSIDSSGVTSPKTAAFSLLKSNKLIENNGNASGSFTNSSLHKRDSVSSSSTLVGSNLHKALNARIIGDENWAPVRDQLILNQTPKQKRVDQMTQQKFRCADCGIQVRKDKIKSFNYCEYFAKYFCRCCHINNQSYIPAYVIYLSDFRTKYEVSKKAKNFLEKIYNEPVITLESLNPQLFDRNSVLTKIKKLRLRLYTCRVYINSCRFATDLRKHLYSQFDDFIINDQHVYSIETLFKIKKTSYHDELKLLVSQIMDHIRQCELCSQQGYICGLCTNPELLYPFDLDKVEKCSNCLACYHRSCLKKPEECPRCRRKRTRIQSSTSGGMPSSTSA